MKQFFVDTSFLVAYYNRNDKNHDSARAFVRDQMLWIVSDYIVDEFLTVLTVRGNKFLSIEAGEKIFSDESIVVLNIDSEIFEKAWQIYKKFYDKNWSFTDCSSYVLMKNLCIEECLSFDIHFRQFGFTVHPPY